MSGCPICVTYFLGSFEVAFYTEIKIGHNISYCKKFCTPQSEQQRCFGEMKLDVLVRIHIWLRQEMKEKRLISSDMECAYFWRQCKKGYCALKFKKTDQKLVE